ncbi:hypothetical protein B842_09005 [Corynebacterium humireducens NBRC 106098 = DSM 45392]|uniref:DUF1206 domain-containing protein n=1 Tax=Corynebacterium humireducens NBRC 106098 = DSM 45392 TaxID=1223515 RepID=A0A0B5D3W1_9CORY|nr:DUF1206 domain-containing protein [Corynebacterium humireducens]AJE33650.1 hypothetical protein B842_09005 [Corynebacterium humireducens NBRC 106098 = DSM 45392]
MDPRSATDSARHHADRAHRHPAVKMMARGGYVVLGVLHILIGWIAVRIATGSGGGEASNSGALATIAQAPGGQLLLWVAVAALAALALWRLTQLFTEEELKDRAKGGVLAGVFASLSFTTATFAAGGSTSDGDTATDVTARTLAQPWGAALVIITGLVVLGVGLFSIHRGATKGFKEDLEAGAGAGNVGSAIVGAGMVGYIARGIAFAILGVLIVIAGWRSDPEQAAGLDAALRTLGEQPFGAVLLIIIGVGLALYGLYSIARARYIRM